MEKEMKITN